MAASIPPIAEYTWGYNVYDSTDNTPGSIGTVVYYERSTGQSLLNAKSVDSSWVINGF